MNVSYHDEFLNDLEKFWLGYLRDSENAAGWFIDESLNARTAIIAYPLAAGHFFRAGARQVTHLRRRNLRRFPFFILYSYDSATDALFFGAILPSRSDPSHWLDRFAEL